MQQIINISAVQLPPMHLIVMLSVLVVVPHTLSVYKERRLPEDFLLGCATSAYQIEGAWNEDGKGENIWDHLIHTNQSVIKDRSNGDIACDSYHKWQRDVEMMRELGLDAYRFSISWSRILPTGFANEVNEAGITYYNNLINEMLKYNIVPMITLYHWDLPQKLQELGGFENPLIADWFEDYARVVFQNFGDRVKLWITFNEPREICYLGYGSAQEAPMLNATAVGTYICAKNLLIAHAKAYHLYYDEFKRVQGGECGITISVNWFGPLTETYEDKFAAEITRQAEWGLYAEPIFSKEGGFPKEFAARVARKSAQQGYRKSRLPSFTKQEKAFVKGTSDFFGVNHYTSVLISATKYKTKFAVPSYYDDIDVGTFTPKEWPQAASSWLRFAPNSVYNALTHLQSKYKNAVFYITENGWSTYGGLEDDDRIRYFRAVLNNVVDCIEDGVKLKGYMAWSLMDNFEWLQGYIERFGLYEVDFKSSSRPRTPRKSAFVCKQIIKTRVIDDEYEPVSRTMTID